MAPWVAEKSLWCCVGRTCWNKVLRKAVYRKVLTGSILPHIVPERGQGSHWRLCGADHGAQQDPAAEEGIALRNWVLEKPYLLTGACEKKAPEPGRKLLPVKSLQCPPLMKQNCTSWQKKRYIRSLLNFLTAGNGLECGMWNNKFITSHSMISQTFRSDGSLLPSFPVPHHSLYNTCFLSQQPTFGKKWCHREENSTGLC